MRTYKLERQADVIEAVLASHKIQSRVWGGTVTPRFIRYDLTASLGTRIQRILALRDELALSLGVTDIRVYRRGGAIRVEVPRPESVRIGLQALCDSVPFVPPLTAILGVDEEGTPLLLRLPSPDVAHVLVAGTTGSGKTVLMRSLIISLARHNPQRALQIGLIDPKSRGFSSLANLPHLVRPIATETTAALKMLQFAVHEMERRDRERRSTPALVIVVDELADLRMEGGGVVEEALSRLTQRGREAGIHLILATQRPAATVVGSLVKANLPVRLVGAVGSPEDAKVATGLAGSGAEKLQGRGDFLLVSRGQIIRMQAAYLSEGEATQFIQEMGSSVTRKPHPPA